MKPYTAVIVMAFIIATNFTSCISGKVTHCNMLASKIVEADSTLTYVLLENGTRIEGARFEKSSKTTVLGISSSHVTFSGIKYKTSEVKAYQDKGEYFERDPIRNDFARRLVHGKTNIYTNKHTLTSPNLNDRMGISGYTSESSCWYYIQNGDGQPLILVKKMQQFADAVQSCTAAYNMLAIKDKALWKITKSNPTYINDAFEKYNNGCKKK